MPEDDLALIHLTLEDALELYAAIIDGTTEHAIALLRSRSALEGALARPTSYAHYQSADLALQAAVLAHGLAESQAFLDGNKRLALVAMLTFLEVNGYSVEVTDPELAGWIIDLSANLTPEQLAESHPAAPADTAHRLRPPSLGTGLGDGSGSRGALAGASTHPHPSVACLANRQQSAGTRRVQQPVQQRETANTSDTEASAAFQVNRARRCPHVFSRTDARPPW